MDLWWKDRDEAIRSGKFATATRDDLGRRAKAVVGRAYFGHREWIVGRARSEDFTDFIDFEFLEEDEGLEKLFAQFEALTEEAKKAIREYFEKKE